MGVGNIMPLTEDIPSLLNGHLLFSVERLQFLCMYSVVIMLINQSTRRLNDVFTLGTQCK